MNRGSRHNINEVDENHMKLIFHLNDECDCDCICGVMVIAIYIAIDFDYDCEFNHNGIIYIQIRRN